jgi:hypothetical protein
MTVESKRLNPARRAEQSAFIRAIRGSLFSS